MPKKDAAQAPVGDLLLRSVPDERVVPRVKGMATAPSTSESGGVHLVYRGLRRRRKYGHEADEGAHPDDLGLFHRTQKGTERVTRLVKRRVA